MQTQTSQHNVEEQSSYSILSYPGTELPDNFRNFIYTKWMRSLRLGNDLFKLIDSDAFYKSYNVIIDRILDTPGTTVKLATLSDDHDVALGFSVSRYSILDYVFVHKDYRRTGIGLSLVPKSTLIITHVTNNGLVFWNSKLPHAKFNPFM